MRMRRWEEMPCLNQIGPKTLPVRIEMPVLVESWAVLRGKGHGFWFIHLKSFIVRPTLFTV